MVEYSMNLDNVFNSLADPIRRDILKRVSVSKLTVGQIASAYDVSLAAISKHLKVLEKAQLIRRQKEGKYHFVTVSPVAFKDANEYLKYYENLWTARFDALDAYLKEEDYGKY